MQIQFSHDTLYSCPTVTPSDPATSVLCVAVPPSGLQKAMNLPVSVTEWPWEALALVRPAPRPLLRLLGLIY